MSYQTSSKPVAAVLASDWCQKNTSFTCDQLSVNIETVRFWKILLAWTEKAHWNKVTCKFSTVYLKRNELQWPLKIRRIYVGKKLLPPSHTQLNGFPFKSL